MHKILVAGGCGYIGTHMVKALLTAGYQVVTIDNLLTGHRELLPGGEFIFGDIGDEALLNRVFQTHKIDAVMHFAAFIEVGESVNLPLKYYRNNVSATISLLQSMVAHRIRNFIFSSTAAVYGEPVYTPIDETHPCLPTSPYGRTKLTIEHILDEISIAHDFRYVALRYFNVAGADPSAEIGECHQPESHLIPLVLQVALGKRDTISIYGTDHETPDGSCVRDYVHVNDLVNAHLLSLKALGSGMKSGVYNLGNNRGHSVYEVIETARRITGHQIPSKETHRRSGDPAVLMASMEKAQRELGWQPSFTTIDQIVSTAWNWHSARNVYPD